MKDTIKIIAAFLAGLIGAAIPVTTFYLLWSWCMAQVPMAETWAGIAKIGITLAMILMGGGATVVLAVLFGVAALSVAAAILRV